MSGLRPLGSPAVVSIRRVVREQYRVEWERDGTTYDHEDMAYAPKRKRSVRFVARKSTAYRMAALRLIFARRDTLATGVDGRGYPAGCSNCGATPPYGPEDQPTCQYHGGEGFDVLVARLARWLRWRDERSGQ